MNCNVTDCDREVRWVGVLTSPENPDWAKNVQYCAAHIGQVQESSARDGLVLHAERLNDDGVSE